MSATTCARCGHEEDRHYAHGQPSGCRGEVGSGVRCTCWVYQAEARAEHFPECNAGCVGDSHTLLASGPFGEPFHGQAPSLGERIALAIESLPYDVPVPDGLMIPDYRQGYDAGNRDAARIARETT